MAKNDFSTDTASNFEQKGLCVLVLDVSGSMRGEPIKALNAGLKDFYEDIYNDDSMSQKIELSIITFNEKVNTIQEPALVENFTMPTLSADGSSNKIVDAMMAAIDLVEQRKEWYRLTGQMYYRPLIILITNGKCNANQYTQNLLEIIKSDTLNRKYNFRVVDMEGVRDNLHEIPFIRPEWALELNEFYSSLHNHIFPPDPEACIDFSNEYKYKNMAKNDFSTESAVNYEQKCLCVLVLDVSGSMREVVDGDVKFTGRKEMIDGQLYDIVEGGVTKLDGLNEGLKDFYNEIYQDDNSSQRIEVALIAFNDTVQKLQDPALVENFTMPTLEASGETALVDAMMSAIDLVEQRKEWYRAEGVPYYRPWIILMTDGEPNANQNIQALADRIKSDTANKKYVFLPIGVAGANMDILHMIEGEGNGKIPAMPLQGAKFSKFFKWLSSSIGTVINSREGDKVSFENPSSWMDNFEI